jgi:signal transduction histidine kinase
MDSDNRPRSIRITGWSLRAAFAAIIVVFVVANMLAMIDARQRQAETREVVTNMLTSIQLVTHLDHDLEEQRRLVDAHVYEKEASDLARLETEIAVLDSDLIATERAYEPLVIFPSERPTFDKLKAEIAGLHSPIDRVLDLSRRDRDAEAHAAAVPLHAQFDAIAKRAVTLVEINRIEGDRAVLNIQDAQDVSLRSMMLLTLAGGALSVAVAIYVTRLLGKREDEIMCMTQQLEERNRELDAFAGRVAHDLRGPLTALSFAAERMAVNGSHERASAAHRRGVARMNALIADLLALSRIHDQASRGTCDPSKVASSISEDWRSRVEEEGGALDVDVEPSTTRVSDGLLRQALANLVDNAVKYRRPDVAPQIAVRGMITAKRTYELRVSDNGIGVSEDDATHVFEPFHRAARTISIPGTGLGLSIVKRVVDACGGRVSIESTIDQGTTFKIELPLSTDDAHV